MIAIGPLVFGRLAPTRLARLRAVIAMQYCDAPGCSRLVTRGRCRVHAVQHEHARGNFAIRRWYRTVAWAHLRHAVIGDQAYACAQCGTVTTALEVDHIRKHEGDPALFWDRANLQALCKACHTQKTTRGA